MPAQQEQHIENFTKGKLHMKALSVVILLLALTSHGEVETNIVLHAVRTSMDSYITNDVSFEYRDPLFVRDMGMRNWNTPCYTNLALTVSNSLDIVLDNIDICATNQFEKYAILGTGWLWGDGYYLYVFDAIMDRVLCARLSLDDARWYNSGHHSERMLNTLARNYDTLIVSNILSKIESSGGSTNYCDWVRSGRAKSEYEEFDAEMNNIKETFQ